jgi:hypothetical protein
MRKIASAIKVHRFAITLVTLSCLAMVVGAGIGWKTRIQTPTAKRAPLVTNKTQAIKVTDVLVTSGTVLVTLLNQSSRYIDFYSFSIGDHRMMPTAGLAPGGASVQKFPLRQIETSAQSSSSGVAELVILALSFADGGGEGDSEEMFNLAETSRGAKDYIKVALPLLVKAANSPTVESEDNLSSIEQEFSQLATVDETSFTPMRKGGQSLAKAIIHHQLESLRDRKSLNSKLTYRDGLVELIASHQSRYSKF